MKGGFANGIGNGNGRVSRDEKTGGGVNPVSIRPMADGALEGDRPKGDTQGRGGIPTTKRRVVGMAGGRGGVTPPPPMPVAHDLGGAKQAQRPLSGGPNCRRGEPPLPLCVLHQKRWATTKYREQGSPSKGGPNPSSGKQASVEVATKSNVKIQE